VRPHCAVVAHRWNRARAQCYSAPGTNWTYDSEKFIEHLSDLVAVTTNQVRHVCSGLPPSLPPPPTPSL
jgi:hypothetical protein